LAFDARDLLRSLPSISAEQPKAADSAAPKAPEHPKAEGSQTPAVPQRDGVEHQPAVESPPPVDNAEAGDQLVETTLAAHLAVEREADALQKAAEDPAPPAHLTAEHHPAGEGNHKPAEQKTAEQQDNQAGDPQPARGPTPCEDHTAAEDGHPIVQNAPEERAPAEHQPAKHHTPPADHKPAEHPKPADEPKAGEHRAPEHKPAEHPKQGLSLG